MTRPFSLILFIFFNSCWLLVNANSVAFSFSTNDLLNFPPDAVNDASEGYEDIIQYGDVSLNDFDPESAELTYTLIEAPVHGTLQLNPDGTFTYTPDPEYAGFDYATYETCDPGGLCDQAEIEFAMIWQNDNPVAVDDSFFAFLNTPLNGSVTLNDYDLDIEPIYSTILDGPDHAASFVLNTNGTFTYTPAPGYQGSDSFLYQLCDPCVACDLGMVTIQVVPPNDPPVANNNWFFNSEDMVFNNNVANNDSDPNGDPLTFSTVTLPTHGTLVFNPNGTLVYTPEPNYYGYDYFTYQACDPWGSCDNANVTLEVIFVNDFEVAVDDYFSTSEDQAFSNTVVTNDIDVDFEPMDYFLTSGVSHGTLIFSEDDGSFTYTPAANYSGNDQFSYLLIDPCGAMDQGDVFISVQAINDAPVAVDESMVILEDNSLSSSVAGNDSDAENDPLTWTKLTGPQQGIVQWNADGSFVYTPALNYSGPDVIIYKVSDNSGAEDTATLNIQVDPVNDAPVAVNDNYSTSEDLQVTGTVAANDSDAELNVLTYSLITGAANGVFTFNPSGNFTYTPGNNFTGTEIITYQVCDPSMLCSTATLTINVGGINDVPVAMNDNFTTSEDVVLAGNVAVNDSDIDNDPLTWTLVNPPLHGAVTLNINGTFTYTPVLNYSGTDQFTYALTDNWAASSSATVFITISAVNDAPVAVADLYTTPEEIVLSGSVAGNDSDVETSVLTFSLTGTPANGELVFSSNGSFTYTPDQNYYGTEVLSYQVCDGAMLCSTGTLTIQITSVNDIPVVSNEVKFTAEDSQYSDDVSENDYDPDGQELTYTIIVPPVHGTIDLNADGTYTYITEPDWNGQEDITYQACDPEGGCASGTLTVNVTFGNDLPIAEDDVVFGSEDTVISGAVGINDVEPDGEEWYFILLDTPENGEISWNNLTGNFTYTPDPDFFGTESLGYLACDPCGACGSATIEINVTSVNDVPVALDDFAGILMDTVLEGTVATNDSDADIELDPSELLTFTAISIPEHGEIVMNPNGSYSYTPEAGYSGLEYISYSVCDNSGACDNTAILTIEIVSTNDTPVVVDDTWYTNEESALVGTVADNDHDPNDDLLVFDIVSDPSAGECFIFSDGSFNFIPPPDFYGTVTMDYEACDIYGACAQATLTIIVNPVNDAPIAVNDVASMMEDGEESGDVSINDNDVDDTDLVFSLVAGPENGVLSLMPDGTYTYTPDENFFGQEVMIYEVCDDSGDCDEALLTIDVLFVNDPPVAVDETFYTGMNEAFEGTVADNDIEIDPEILHYELLEPIENGVINFFDDGTFSYVPNDGFVGTETVSYSACDPCGSCDVGMLTIIVTEVNSEPYAAEWSMDICALDPAVIDLDGLISDLETSDDDLVITSVSLSSGTWNLDDHILSVYPESGFGGILTVNFSVCDDDIGNSLCASGSISIDVTPAFTPVITNTDVQDILCYGDTNGSIDIEVESGGNNLIYIWNTEDTTQDITNLASGEFTVIISSDASCGLPHTQTFTVNGPDSPLTIDGLQPDPIDETSGGSGDYEITGGTPPYSYLWTDSNDNIVSTNDILGPFSDPADEGSYTLHVTDANGCTISQTIVVTDIIDISNDPGISVFPNPATSEITLNVTGAAGSPVQVNLTDATGRVVLSEKISSGGNSISIPVDIESFAPGIYDLRVMAGDFSNSLRVIKE